MRTYHQYKENKIDDGLDDVSRLDKFILNYQKDPSESNFLQLYNQSIKIIQANIRKIKNKFPSISKDQEKDLFECGIIGMIRATKVIKVHLKQSYYYIKAYTYAEMMKHIRSEHSNQSFDSDFLHHVQVQRDVSAHNSFHNTKQISSLFIEWASKKLSPDDRNLFEDYYVNGMTLQEIADKRGRSKQLLSHRISQTIKPLFKKAQDFLPIWGM